VQLKKIVSINRKHYHTPTCTNFQNILNPHTCTQNISTKTTTKNKHLTQWEKSGEKSGEKTV